MRVAVDAANLVRDRRGLGRVTRAVLVSAARDAAFDVTLLADTSADRTALIEEFPQFGVASARGASKRDTYDVVWYPFNGMRFDSAAPTLVTIADAFAFTDPHPERIARAREQAPIRRAARKATRIVTISQWSREEIERELSLEPHRVDVVPLEASAYWSPGSARGLPLAIETSRFALVVGVREPRKNARLALDAFARARRDDRERLVIVGALGSRDAARASTLGLTQRPLRANDAGLRALYRAASMVLVPSLAEGFGLIAAEALACGAPVIAADGSALAEACKGASLMRDPRDVDGWANAIRDIYDDHTVSQALRARAARAFDTRDPDAPARAMLALLGATAGI